MGSWFTAEMAQAAERLRLIQVAAAGTDKVDFRAVPPDVLVANTFHHERSIAENAVAAAVMLRRDFLAQDRQLRHCVWATSVYDASIPQPSTLTEARIGFGHIGRRAWNMFRAFGCTGATVTGSGRVADCGLSWAGDAGELDRLMDECDVAVVSAPLNEHTEGMIGTAQLRALGADRVVINVGRGRLVQQRALYEALSAGAIRAASTTSRPTSGGCSGANRCEMSWPARTLGILSPCPIATCSVDSWNRAVPNRSPASIATAAVQPGQKISGGTPSAPS